MMMTVSIHKMGGYVPCQASEMPTASIHQGESDSIPDAMRIDAGRDVNANLIPAHSRLTMLIAVLLPFLGLIASMVLLWEHGFSWIQLGIFLAMFFPTSFGITLGYHRLFTHRAFETTRPVKLALAVLGSMAVEGPLLKWVAVHRRHHQYNDEIDDPHSPHVHGNSIRGVLRGFWHAHLGWMFQEDPPGLSRYVRDLVKDRWLRITSQMFPVWVTAGFVIPTALGGLLTWSWLGAVMGLAWGGLARVFLVHHMTFSINSVCHIWGGRPFLAGDQSRNNVVFGVLGLGEGWHNNHHAFPASARHGLAWWQLDMTYLLIRGLEALRLVWRVRLPGADKIAAKLRENALGCELPA